MQGLSPLELSETPAREGAYAVLRGAILDGRLVAGQRLVERDLAEVLGISRTPVREALQKLEQERLVRKLARRGMVVAGLTEREVSEIYLIRSSLEGLATGLAAERRTTEQMQQMEEYLAGMRSAMETGDLKRYRQLHFRFNQLIYEAADSPRLHAMLLQLRESIGLVLDLAYRVPGRLEEVNVEHTSVVAAVRSRNSEAAAAAARYHMQRSLQAALDGIRPPDSKSDSKSDSMSDSKEEQQ